MLIPLAIALYLLPSIVAGLRHHPQLTPIIAANLLFGWTGFGWAACLVYALWRHEPHPA